jgi:hypothetical protein
MQPTGMSRCLSRCHPQERLNSVQGKHTLFVIAVVTCTWLDSMSTWNTP